NAPRPTAPRPTSVLEAAILEDALHFERMLARPWDPPYLKALGTKPARAGYDRLDLAVRRAADHFRKTGNAVEAQAILAREVPGALKGLPITVDSRPIAITLKAEDLADLAKPGGMGAHWNRIMGVSLKRLEAGEKLVAELAEAKKMPPGAERANRVAAIEAK